MVSLDIVQYCAVGLQSRQWAVASHTHVFDKNIIKMPCRPDGGPQGAFCTPNTVCI
jgi:hypothetical protein